MEHETLESVTQETGKDHLFKPGKSGNPKGKPRVSWGGFASELKSALHKLTDHGDQTKKAAIINELINIALYDEKADTRLKAIDMILNRTDGAPKQSIELSAMKPADEWSKEELNTKLAEAGLAIAAARNPLDLIECRTDGDVIESEVTR